MADCAGAPAQSAGYAVHAEVFQGLPCRRLTLADGDTVLVALHGAHVLSWVAQGRERLFLSERNAWPHPSAIRGGVPVCFPQFNQRGNLPKHGFARTLAWQASESSVLVDTALSFAAQLEFTLTDQPATHALWPQRFVATLRVGLQPGQLHITLCVDNTDVKALHFSGALHTYLAVDQIAQTQLTGLGGQPEWDAVADVHGRAAEVLRFGGEFDRVYQAGPQPLRLQDRQGALQIAQSPSWGQSVVWNPGPHKGAALADMSAQGYQQMLCVEAAQVDAPIQVAPGAQWQGWQRLSLV